MLGHPLSGLALAVVLLAVLFPRLEPSEAQAAACPDGMTSVLGQFCIDRYEAAVDELFDVKSRRVKGKHSPYESVAGKAIKAVSRRGRTPQGYISQQEAALACHLAGKRLCTDQEWLTACRGRTPTRFPYGEDHRPGYCNDRGKSSFNFYYGVPGGEAPQSAYTWENMNDPRLNKMPGTLASAGGFVKCRNSFRAHDMVGNLHEWTAAPTGTFRGGYYLDTTQHGNGCDYVTTAHNVSYHDYSTGFRCCEGGRRTTPALLAKLGSPSRSTRAVAVDEPEAPRSTGGASDRTDARKRTFGKRPPP